MYKLLQTGRFSSYKWRSSRPSCNRRTCSRRSSNTSKPTSSMRSSSEICRAPRRHLPHHRRHQRRLRPPRRRPARRVESPTTRTRGFATVGFRMNGRHEGSTVKISDQNEKTRHFRKMLEFREISAHFQKRSTFDVNTNLMFDFPSKTFILEPTGHFRQTSGSQAAALSVAAATALQQSQTATQKPHDPTGTTLLNPLNTVPGRIPSPAGVLSGGGGYSAF